jgi:hypothetical protein
VVNKNPINLLKDRRINQLGNLRKEENLKDRRINQLGNLRNEKLMRENLEILEDSEPTWNVLRELLEGN